MTSSSTGVPSGRLATPYTRRLGFLSCPKTSCSSSECAVGYFRLVANIAGSCHEDAEPDDPRHFVQRSQMMPRHGEDVQRRQTRCLAPGFHRELRAHAPHEFRAAALGRKHSAQKKQVAGLHRFRIGAERLGRRGEVDAELLQSLFSSVHVQTRVQKAFRP